MARGSSNRCLRVKALSILTVTSLSSRSRSYHFSVACSSPTASHDVRDLCPNSLFSFSAAKVSLESPYRFHFPASSSHTFRSPSFFLPLELLAIRSTITRLVSQDSITVTSRFNVNRIVTVYRDLLLLLILPIYRFASIYARDTIVPFSFCSSVFKMRVNARF